MSLAHESPRGWQALGSSLRMAPADATWRIASALMAVWGITRVTDITRLDRLGLPVYASVRPRGRALCVHAGKGLRPAEARIGALMEALEFAVAEPQRSAWQGRDFRIAELEADWAGAFGLADLAPVFGVPIERSRLLHAVRCEELAGRGDAWLPAELVFLPWEDPHGPALFGWSSNGLASGNTLAEATLHGLLEVLERDALLMNLPRDRSQWLDADEFPAPFDTFAARWQEMGIELSVRQVPNEFDLPCFQALLMEAGGTQTVDLAGGSGLHLDPAIAFARAVCEAAQSRASCIHGGRDDVTEFYDHLPRTPGGRDTRQTLAAREAFDRRHRVRWCELPSMPFADAATLDEVLARLLTHLATRGFSRVLRHRFDVALQGLHVVKIIVPGCQEASAPLDRAGRRLLALAHADG